MNKYGIYGDVGQEEPGAVTLGGSIPCYIGTAPVHVADPTNVNRPVLVESFDACLRKFGYSEDWAAFTLCEAMAAHFLLATEPVGPIILINAFNPTAHETDADPRTLQFTNGKAVLAGMALADLSTLTFSRGKVGTDWLVSYNYKTGALSVTALASVEGEPVTLSYKEVGPDEVTTEEVVGGVDEYGAARGIAACANIYSETGVVPGVLLAPGFSGVKAVRDKLMEMSVRLNGHWNMMVYTDIPVASGEGMTTLTQARSWRATNGYIGQNEVVHYPTAPGTDGRVYHLSTLSAVAMQQLAGQTDGIPYRTASNTPAPIKGLFLGESNRLMVLDQDTVSRELAAYGIRSACYWGGAWRLWGAATADYSIEESEMAVSDTNIMMLYHVCNWFQQNFADVVDQPMTPGTASTIASRVNQYLASLRASQMIVGGSCSLRMDESDLANVIAGHYRFEIAVATTPLLKSAEAVIVWTQDGVYEYLFGGEDE